MELEIDAYDAVTFDCYGTLIDWDVGVANMLGPWAVRHGVEAGCSDLLATFAEAQYRHQRIEPFKPYREVLTGAFRDLAADYAVAPGEAELDTFAGSVGGWPRFLDSIASLRWLKAAGRHLAVASNVDDSSFARTRERLGGLIDTAVTAESVGAYKPDPRMFEALIGRLGEAGVDRDRILHVAQSRFHDVAPGRAAGLDVVWVDRRAGRPGRGITIESDAEPTFRVTSLAELIEHLEGC